MRITSFLSVALLLFSVCSFGQFDSSLNKATSFPNRLFDKINKKATGIDDALTRQTEKYLQKMLKKEQKIREHLYKMDSNAAKNIFEGSQVKYASLQNTVTTATSSQSSQLSGEYMPYVDSLKTSLAFAQNNPQLINATPKVQGEIAASLAQFNKLQNNFTNADQVRDYIQQRKQELKDRLAQYMQNSEIKKYLDEYNKQVYYYSQQLKEFKQALNDPDLMMKKALVILNKIPAFTDFMKKNSQLSIFLGMPDDYGTAAGLVGLQTKDQVQQLLQEQLGAPGSSGLEVFQNNLESAHDQLDLFKDKLGQLGSGSADIPMPDFKPNNQKTHPFLKRLELGMNLQTTKADYYFPTTTDIGVSIGYKINDKSVIGIGGSYNIGWGQGINRIHVTSNGASVRSFLDVKLKKSIYFSGGFELNYQKVITSLVQISSIHDWSRSGLIGISKMVSLPGKLVKRTKLQFFWDFLSYTQIPKTQPLIFRVGYNF